MCSEGFNSLYGTEGAWRRMVQVGAVDDTDFLMQRFPGPLTPAVPKEKVLSVP